MSRKTGGDSSVALPGISRRFSLSLKEGVEQSNPYPLWINEVFAWGHFYLNWIMPITTMTIMANITAPSKPNVIQPTRNAMTENNPIIPQFTSIAFFNHLVFVFFPVLCISSTLLVNSDLRKISFPCISQDSRLYKE
jgi:hypothetical protein